MRFPEIRFVFAAGCSVLASTSKAEAATYRIEATGTISQVGSEFAALGFEAGQQATLLFEYDTSPSPVLSGPHPIFGGSFASYADVRVFVSMTFNGKTYSETISDVAISVNDNDFFEALGFSPNASSPRGFEGVSGLTLNWSTEGEGEMLSGASLSQIPDLTDLSASSAFGFFGSDRNLVASYASATFTELPPVPPVPLPAGVPLLLGGFGALVALKARKGSAKV